MLTGREAFADTNRTMPDNQVTEVMERDLSPLVPDHVSWPVNRYLSSLQTAVLCSLHSTGEPAALLKPRRRNSQS